MPGDGSQNDKGYTVSYSVQSFPSCSRDCCSRMSMFDLANGPLSINDVERVLMIKFIIDSLRYLQEGDAEPKPRI